MMVWFGMLSVLVTEKLAVGDIFDSAKLQLLIFRSSLSTCAVPGSGPSNRHS